MSFVVELSGRAQADVRRIFVWITKRSPQGARNWLEALDGAILAMGANPEQHSRAPEDPDHPETIRNAFFSTKHGRTYRAIFIMRAGAVFVTHVRGPRQRVIPAVKFYPK